MIDPPTECQHIHPDGRIAIEPLDEDWARCDLCGDGTFPISARAAYGEGEFSHRMEDRIRLVCPTCERVCGTRLDRPGAWGQHVTATQPCLPCRERGGG